MNNNLLDNLTIKIFYKLIKNKAKQKNLFLLPKKPTKMKLSHLQKIKKIKVLKLEQLEKYKLEVKKIGEWTLGVDIFKKKSL